MTPCTCTHGEHDPREPGCDRAILDGTATPVYAEAPISEHPITHLGSVVGGYLGRCTGCDVIVQGRNAADALTLHLRTVRGCA